MRLLLLLVALSLTPDALAQVDFAIRAGGPRNDTGIGVAPDGAGGAFVTGSFTGETDLDDDGVADLSSAGIWDTYVARYDASGALVFAVQVGGPESDFAAGVAPDGAGGAFVVGTYRGSIDADGDGAPDLSGSQSNDNSYLARFDAAGALAFIVPVGGFGSLRAAGVTPDGSGRVYVTGDFAGSADFDGDGAADLTSAGRNDAFLARYDATGGFDVVWRLGGTLADYGEAVAPDGAGGVLMTGSFAGTVDLDGDGVADLTSNGDADLFVVRYDASGAVVFAVGAGGPSRDEGRAVAPDGTGGAFVSGAFRTRADFDGDGADDFTATSLGDAFVARYQVDGDLAFATALRSVSATGLGLAPDGDGGVFAVGLFGATADPDGDGTPDLTSAGGSDAFLLRLGAAGEVASSRQFGGPGNDAVRAVSVDGDGRQFVVGDFRDQIDLDGDGAPDLTSAGRDDAFLVRLGTSAVDAEPSAPPAGVALSVGPNPVGTIGTVTVEVGAPVARARVTLYDALGRRVAVVWDGPLAAGATAVRVDVSPLPAGLYMVRASTPTGFTARPISVAR